MTVVFVSNYYNHHQSEVCKAFDRQTDHGFTFIETEPMEAERQNMGWGKEQKPEYVMQSYPDFAARERAQERIDSADVVIWGSCPFEMIKPRLKRKKLTFAYSERIFKSGGMVGRILRSVKYFCKLKPYQKNHYLLCASGYAAEDYNSIGLFRDATIPWGYFPAVRTYDDVEALLESKEENTILWVARLIPWKHPEHALEVARRLKQAGYRFRLNMIGVGELAQTVSKTVEDEGLENYVNLLGAMTPEQVRDHMEKSQVFLFTSDRNEGWGAVLNEAMNSACAVVACRTIGAVPYLLQEERNGLAYDEGDVDGLFAKTKALLDEPQMRRSYGTQAYHTIAGRGNAEESVKKLLKTVRLQLGMK